MHCIVARQPIFDRANSLFAYELLFRSGLDNAFPPNTDGNAATISVLTDTYFSLGIETITDGNMAFINFTSKLLKNNIVELFPKDSLVVEILEDVIPDDEVISSLERIKGLGYRVALDDYTGSDLHDCIFKYADIIKIDFQATTRKAQEEFIEKFKPYGVKMLAEKVETDDDLRAAMDMGYNLFQGFYFCQPKLIKRERIPEYRLSKIELLKAVSIEPLDYSKIELIIKHDIDLSYKLLRYINSAFFGLRHKATDIKQALVILGGKQLKKWASLMAISCLGHNKPPELLLISVIFVDLFYIGEDEAAYAN